MKRFAQFNIVIASAFSLAFGLLLASKFDLVSKPYAGTNEVASLTGGPVSFTSREAVAAAKGLSDAFVEISEHVKPAVVNIMTSSKQRQARGPQVFRFGTPGGPDQFDQFWKHFFGEEDPFGGRRGGPQEEAPQDDGGQLTPSGQGSGFIVDPEGIILTNAHVVKGADLIEVKVGHDNDEETYKAEVVGTDERTDLAVIRIKANRRLPYLNLGNSDSLRVGEWVVAIGNPFGVGKTVTTGILSAKERSIGYGPYDDYLQTDASINPGNSGGPLVNLRGEVVGVNAAIYTPSGGFVGIGFAIPSNLAKKIYEQLKTKGVVTRGWLGIYIGPVSRDVAEAMGLPTKGGVLVKRVIPGGPSDKAGFKDGDVVIEFDGQKTRDDKHLLNMVADTPVGKTVNAKVFRNGKTVDLNVKIAKRDEDAIARGEYTGEGSGGAGPETAQNSELGITVRNLDAETRKTLPRKDVQAVFVSAVKGGSPADRAQLKPGDLIKSVNRRPTPDTKAFSDAIKSSGNQSYLVEFVREGITDFTVLKAD